MNWMVWDGIIAVVALIGIIMAAVGVKKNQIVPLNFFTILAAAGCAYLAYMALFNGFIAAMAAYFVILLFGMRWPEWIGHNRKFGRLVFWFMADLPVLALVFASWVYWHIAWLTAAVLLASCLVHIFMTNVVLKPVFPIIGHQQALVVARRLGVTAQIKTVEKDLKRLELTEHLKRMLGKIKRHQDLMVQAQNFIRAKNLVRATACLQEIIQDLGPLPRLDPRQKFLLGNALLLRGKVHGQLKQNDEAVADIEKAKNYVKLDEEAVAILALNAVQKKDTSKKGIRYCLDYLMVRKGQADNTPVQQVKSFLESICSVALNLPAAELKTKKETLSQLVEAAPEMPAALLGLGQVLVLLSSWAEAVDILERAHKVAPKNPSVHEFLGRGYENLGRFGEARDAYEESLRLNPQQAETAHTLGLIYLEERIKGVRAEDNLEAALHWLGEAARLKPDQADYSFDLARAYEKKGDLKRAEEELERSLKLAPQSLKARRMLGNLLFDRGDFAGALDHYRREAAVSGWKDPALMLNAGICMVETSSMKEGLGLLMPLTGSKPGALIYTGRAHYKLNEYEEAARDIRQFIRSVKTIEIAEYYLGCAVANLNLKSASPDYQEALNCFDAVVRRNGAFANRAHLHLGKIYQLQQDLDTSLIHYQACARQADTQLDAGLGLAQIYTSRNQLPEARAIMDFLVGKYSKDKRVQAQCAGLAELQGDLEQAQARYAALGNIGAQGVILFRQDKTDQAIRLLEKARFAGDQTDRVIYYCGLGRVLKGEFEGAISEWNLLLTRHPEDNSLALDLAQVWYLQGCQLIQGKQYSQAAEAWEHAIPRFETDGRFMRSFQQVCLLTAFGQLGKPEAIRSIERALSLGADPQLCLYWQAVSHMIQGDLTNGAAEMTRYLAMQPVDAQAQYNLGVAQVKMGQAQAAAPHLESAAKIGKKAVRQQAAWALAAEHALSKEWKQVVELAAGEEPGKLSPWQTLLVVTALIQVGETSQAHQLAAQNRSAEAHTLLGAAFIAQADSETALAEYRLALKINPQHNPARQGAALVLMSVAAEHAGKKQWKEAQACLKEARELAPNDLAVQRLTETVDGAAVLAGVSLENEDQAISILERLQKGDPCRIDFAHQLAIMDHRRAIKLETASPNGDRDRMWLRAIANWAVVLSGDEYWQRWLAGRQILYAVPIPPQEVDRLRVEVVKNRLKDIHAQFIQAYASAGKTADATRHRRLSARLGLEMSAARAMSETRQFLASKGKKAAVAVNSGPQFWEQYGLVKEAGQMADEALRLSPGFQPAQVLKDALQSTGLAKALVDELQIDEAIDLLREFLGANPNDTSAKALMAKALIIKLQAQVNTDLEGALATWQEAKKYGADAAEAETTIFNGVMSLVSQAQNRNDYNAAEQVLRMAIKAMPQNRMLKDKLAEMAGKHVSEMIGAKLQAMGSNLEPTKVTPILEEGKRLLKEIDKVVGPNHPIIQKNLGELYGLSAQMTVPVINTALEKFGKKSITLTTLLTTINSAVTILEEAVRYAPNDEHIKKNLTDLREVRVNVLNSQAVELANDAGYDLQHSNPSGAIIKLRQARDLLNQAHGYNPYHTSVNENLAMVNKILGQVGL